MAIIENIKIDVGMVNYNCDISILNSSVKSILKKTKYLNKLIICDNGSNKENLDFLSGLEKLEKIKIIYRKQSIANSSIAKGEGLNNVIKFFETQYGSFVENDGVLIMKDWDEYLINEIESRNLDIIGNEHASKKQDRKINESFTTFSIFKTQSLLKAKINFLPKGVKENFIYGEDTGYQMIEKLDEDKAEILNLKSGRLKETIHFNFDGFAEYQYQNKPIFAHFGRGSSHSRVTFEKKKFFLDFLKYCYRFFTSKLLYSSGSNIFETKIKLYIWNKIVKKIL